MLRLFCRARAGTVIEYGTPAFDAFVAACTIKLKPGTRAVVRVDIHQVGSSCGFSMPRYEFKDFRCVLFLTSGSPRTAIITTEYLLTRTSPTLDDFISKRVAADAAGRRADGLEHYWCVIVLHLHLRATSAQRADPD